MKTDRELLELAAKAAGICLDWEWDGPPDQWQPWYYEGKTLRNWNPLTDDGDAFRLAVKLSMMTARRININGEFVIAEIPGRMFEAEPVAEDWYAATRRAVTRAAAEIGSQS